MTVKIWVEDSESLFQIDNVYKSKNFINDVNVIGLCSIIDGHPFIIRKFRLNEEALCDCVISHIKRVLLNFDNDCDLQLYGGVRLFNIDTFINMVKTNDVIFNEKR